MRAAVVQVSVSNGGVPKYPISAGKVTPLGIAGDVQAHPGIHGGPRQAVLLITSEGLDELKEQGYPLYPGALGENITSQGLDRRTVRLGQRYRIGEVVIEITKMRQPCAQLNPYGDGIQKAVFDPEVKAGNAQSPRWGLAGFYAKIVQSGRIQPGDSISLLEEAA